MSAIDQFVDVQISRDTAGISAAGFGTPLILGPNSPYTYGVVTSYASIAAVAADYDLTDPEYLKALKIFSQTPRPQGIKIAKTSTPVARVVTITPNVTTQEVFAYVVTINGVEFSFSSDGSPTASEVVTGLISAINAGTEPVTASGTTTLILTSDSPGLPFTYSLGARLTGVETTPDAGIAADILKVLETDNDWYFLLTTAADDVTVKAAAMTVEALKKLYFFLNNDDDVRTNVTNDLVSDLQLANYSRTAVVYSETVADHADAALVGRVAPLNPGSETWANKTLAGVTVDMWTDGEKAYLDGKNANYYIRIANRNITVNGKVVSGEYIDIMRFVDWIAARMQEKIFGTIVRADKIPFTDGGIAAVEGDMRSRDCRKGLTPWKTWCRTRSQRHHCW